MSARLYVHTRFSVKQFNVSIPVDNNMHQSGEKRAASTF